MSDTSSYYIDSDKKYFKDHTSWDGTEYFRDINTGQEFKRENGRVYDLKTGKEQEFDEYTGKYKDKY